MPLNIRSDWRLKPLAEMTLSELQVYSAEIQAYVYSFERKPSSAFRMAAIEFAKPYLETVRAEIARREGVAK